jgi:hypothetical protein
MNGAVMRSAEGNGEFIARLTAERARLHERDVMGVRRACGQGCWVTQKMVFVAVAPGTQTAGLLWRSCASFGMPIQATKFIATLAGVVRATTQEGPTAKTRVVAPSDPISRENATGSSAQREKLLQSGRSVIRSCA